MTMESDREVIALSHGGLEKGKDGRCTDGDDLHLAKAAPGIDVVTGGHSHTALHEAIIVNDRTPVAQTGKEGSTVRVESHRLYAIDGTIAGDQTIADAPQRSGEVRATRVG